MGEKQKQSVRIASRCLWDDKRDTWASASFHNKNIFVVGEVYAVLKE